MKVYARDYYCDELYGEIGNYCITDYEVKTTNIEKLDLEELIAAMIEEGWLDSDDKATDFKLDGEDDYYYYIIQISTKEQMFKISKNE